MKQTFFPTMALGLLLFAGLQNALAAVTFTNSPAVVSNTYLGTITLNVAGLTNGETVVIQKFLDLNTNGVIDATDWLVQQFKMTDGKAGMLLGGVTNYNVPGDMNSATGAITATMNFNSGDFMQTLVAKYLFKLSSSAGRFTPITNLFTVTNFPFGQKFTGNVVSNNTATTLANAVVMLMANPQGSPVAGTVANNSGTYSIQMPVGSYTPMAFRTNFLVNMMAAPTLTLSNLATVTTNLSLTNTTTSIGGRLVDAASPGTGIPGVLCLARSTNGLFGVGFSNTNGNFAIAVRLGGWNVKAEGSGLLVNGYVGLDSGTNVNAGTLTITNALPKATALIYGSVKDIGGNPMPGLLVGGSDDNHQYYVSSSTDTNGNYMVGVMGLGVSDYWWAEVQEDRGPVNYVFSRTAMDGNIVSNTAVVQDFTGIPATNRITGTVTYNGSPVAGVSIQGNMTIGGTNYQSLWLVTDNSGNYSMKVCNGIWNVTLNCYGGSEDSLDTALGAGTYACPNQQQLIVFNANVTNNIVIQPCGKVVIDTASPVLPGEVNVYYSQLIQAASCDTSYTWQQTVGSLPPGLSLVQNGLDYQLSGTPNTGGNYSFTVRVTDAASHVTNKQFSVSISNALQIITASLPSGTNGQSYSQQLAANGGQPPYYWTLPGGSLPPNLTLSTNGLLSGTATASGTFNFTAGVADILGGSATQPLSVTINGTNSLPPPSMGIAMAAGQFFVCYPTTGSNYVLQTATNVDGPWVTASNGVPAISIIFSNVAPATFYRLH